MTNLQLILSFDRKSDPKDPNVSSNYAKILVLPDIFPVTELCL